ncbi:zinc finger protein 317-like [Ctenocephalides felis]|uniref:zinc finger protein 317-like n=1 Tax=Ctenocephalides felis TaxID=7515 RepID=UPI000E6E4F56|nr:zinc finger protein 317-like [Ctenocephalides felis]
MNMNSVPDITLKALKHQIKMVIKQMSLFQQDDINKAITFLQQCILKNLKSNGLTMIPIFFNNKHYDFMKSSSKSTRFGAKYYMDMKTKGVLRVVNMPQFRSIIVHYKHKKLGFKTKCLKEIKYFKHIKTSRESEKENNYYNPQSNTSLIETNTYETELLVNEETDDNYSDTSDLSSGLSINHDGGYKCCKCDLVFMQKQQLGIHLKNHNKYKCLDCPMTFSNQKLALKHKNQSSNKNSDPDASVHNIEGLEKSTLKCFICPRTFYRVKKLKNHMQAHAVNNLLSCPVCKASYKTRNILELHIKSHKNTLECNLNEINDISEEKNENITDVIQENLSLICDLCGKIFTKRTSLTQHKKRSHGEARYSCELCDFSSKSSFNLRRHLISHTSERPIICDQCGMAFRNASALKEHILYAHNKDCQHQCEMCPKKFKVKSALSRHLQSCHSNERPYACQWCKQAYKRSSHLRRHELQRHGDLKTKNPQTLNDLKKNDEGKTFKWKHNKNI